MFKHIFGLAPILESDGSYSPSKMALKIALSAKTDFENISYQKYEGKKSKILVIFTETKNLEMKNGKYFSTGNHPVEALLPMLHLKNAGFEFEITTPTGKPVVFEMWAFPEKDEHVKAIYNENKPSFEKPIKLSDFITSSFDQSDSYAAVFVPGGHGAMIGIPEDKNVGKIGDCCLFSSSQIFHRAGVPRDYRDNMQIILITIPRKYSEGLDKIDNIKLFQNNYELFQKFTKPYSIIKVISLFFTLFKYKFNGLNY